MLHTFSREQRRSEKDLDRNLFSNKGMAFMSTVTAPSVTDS
ncbi:MAG: hypothetical protein JWQ02_1749, partial [Capsulimonas sp.]|nr:hypothetical protein [Capsulimonas sp.]